MSKNFLHYLQLHKDSYACSKAFVFDDSLPQAPSLTADARENVYTKEVDEGWFMFWITALNHLYWFSGATLGGILGSLVTFNTKAFSKCELISLQ